MEQLRETKDQNYEPSRQHFCIGLTPYISQARQCHLYAFGDFPWIMARDFESTLDESDFLNLNRTGDTRNPSRW